jgi:predicted RNase H-like HicB family nuclease
MSELRRYKVKLIKSPECLVVNCPELPGRWSQGKTEEDALRNIGEAIKDYLAQPSRPLAASVASLAPGSRFAHRLSAP